MQPPSGEQKKFINGDVRGQGSLAQRLCVEQIRIAAEKPLDHRLDEAPLDFVFRMRLFKGERGEDRERNRRVRRRAAENRVGDVVRLAESERQSEHDLLAYFADDIVREL